MLLLGLTVATCSMALGRSDAAGPRRARPPKFDKSTEDAFFTDARDKLVGPRPAAPVAGTAPVAATPPSGTTPTAEPATTGTGWSSSITAEAVEDEIKSQQIKLAQSVANPTQFGSGDYRQARVQLSVLAVMFGIVAEYDGRIRWQGEAAAVRDLMSRAGHNCKVGSEAAYKEARARADEVQTLVRGGSVQLPEPGAELDWSKVADRPPLMKRLDEAQQQSVTRLTANAQAFERDADTLAHEAQVIAAVAEVISREGYEFADDETYLEYARAMKTQALSLREAAMKGDYDQARAAAGQLGKACSNCHDGYRG